MMRKLSAIAVVLGLLLTLVGAVETDAKSRTVRCDEGADLQRAIDRADSGDTIAIKGVCRGEFVVDGKKLTLKGRGWVDGSLLVTGTKGRAILRDLGVAGGGYAGEEEPDIIIPTRDVVIATQAIAAGDTIEPTLVSARAVPRDETTEMALLDPTMAHGAVAAIDILPFQMITPNMLEDGPIQADPMEESESPNPSPDG
jgi:hypothetical protein